MPHRVPVSWKSVIYGWTTNTSSTVRICLFLPGQHMWRRAPKECKRYSAASGQLSMGLECQVCEGKEDFTHMSKAWENCFLNCQAPYFLGKLLNFMGTAWRWIRIISILVQLGWALIVTVVLWHGLILLVAYLLRQANKKTEKKKKQWLLLLPFQG